MKLPWISDKDLDKAVNTMVSRVKDSIKKVDKRMETNVIDPFSSILIASSMKVSSLNVLQLLQKNASILSSISNSLGFFHQKVLSSFEGWENHDAGYDLENKSKRIVAEIKNKHNTMNASNKDKVISDLDTAVQQKGKGWKGYLVIIIPKKSGRYNTRLPVKRDVFETDGNSFYDLVSGRKNTLRELFLFLLDILPERLDWEKCPEVIEYCKSVWRDDIS